jgi:hypothetical protein
VRDLLLLRVAAEKALRAGDFKEVARVHRQISRAEARLRDGLKARTRDAEVPELYAYLARTHEAAP